MTSILLLNPENTKEFNENLSINLGADVVCPATVESSDKQGNPFQKPIFEITGWASSIPNTKRGKDEISFPFLTGEEESIIIFAKLNLSLLLNRHTDDGKQVWAHRPILLSTKDNKILGDQLFNWAQTQQNLGCILSDSGKFCQPNLKLRNEGVEGVSFAHLISHALEIELDNELKFNKNSGFYYYKFSFDFHKPSAKIVFKGMGYQDIPSLEEQTPDFSKEWNQYIDSVLSGEVNLK